ncbi:response regulator [Paraconexibacter algicola]|nr:response regulator transcription factor [Paraconexibacter algicola]
MPTTTMTSAGPDPPVRIGISVLVADDHPLYRDGLARAVNAHPDLDLLGHVSDGTRALAAIRRHEPDVAVMDIDMPGMSGLEVLEEVVGADLATRVVLISSHLDGPTVHQAIAVGAFGVLLKDAGPQEISAAARAATDGDVVLSPAASSLLARAVRDQRGVPALIELTDREREVLELIAEGRSAPEIAGELYLAPATVKSHLHTLYTKLGVSDRAAAVAVAFRRGVLQ